MKRSRNIRLILIGTLSAGTLAGCSQKTASISSENVYTNNFYVPGVGYYHAPFRAWYPLPYNDFNPLRQQYYYAGNWWDQPFQSITNISPPTAEVAALAQSSRTDVSRGGFGGYGGGGYYGGSSYHGWGIFS